VCVCVCVQHILVKDCPSNHSTSAWLLFNRDILLTNSSRELLKRFKTAVNTAEHRHKNEATKVKQKQSKQSKTNYSNLPHTENTLTWTLPCTMLYRFPTKHVKSRKSARVGKVELLINMIQTAQWSEEEEEEVGRVVLVCMCHPVVKRQTSPQPCRATSMAEDYYNQTPLTVKLTWSCRVFPFYKDRGR